MMKADPTEGRGGRERVPAPVLHGQAVQVSDSLYDATLLDVNAEGREGAFAANETFFYSRKGSRFLRTFIFSFSRVQWFSQCFVSG